MFQATQLSGTAPTFGVQPPLAAAQPNQASQANVELIRSADVLSRVAESRPHGFVQGAELVEMANNGQGQYHRDIQHAARVFLANNSGVYRAREAIRRRHANPHSACGGGRAYDFQDLQSISDYMQQHRHDQQGQQEQQGQQGQQNHGHGAYSFGAGMDANMAGHVPHGLFEQLAAAIQHLTAAMTSIRRRHMSLERLMHMGHHGNPGAQYMLNQPDVLSRLIDREVHRNMAITFERLQQIGIAADAQGNITSLGGLDAAAGFGGHGGGTAGQWASPGFQNGAASPGFSSTPDFSSFQDISNPASPNLPTSPPPNFYAAADDQRRQDVMHQQQARDFQLRQDERQRVIRNDAIRNTNLQARQHRIDSEVRQQRIADDVAADRRVADDIAAQQRLADEIRADQIRADQK